MVAFTVYPSTTTKQKFTEYAASSSPVNLKDRKFLFPDKTAQSSRLNYVYEESTYGQEREIIYQTTIDALINFNYTLEKPIKVKIIKSTSGVIGDIEELELYSFGKNEFEVLRELNEELVSLFEDLIEMEDKNLGKHPKKWKSILNQYIKRIK